MPRNLVVPYDHYHVHIRCQKTALLAKMKAGMSHLQVQGLKKKKRYEAPVGKTRMRLEKISFFGHGTSSSGQHRGRRDSHLDSTMGELLT